jgi:formylglycine-generating enzyme required for sulfatase activity
MQSIPRDFWTQSYVKRSHPIALEAEGGGDDESLNWSTMGWGYFSYNHVPSVARYKWLSSGKFMTNTCDRWAFSKTDNLHTTWLNGIGYESWENVWGTWNGITERGMYAFCVCVSDILFSLTHTHTPDAEALRRVAHMLRFFGGRDKSYVFEGSDLELLQSEMYEPHVSNIFHEDVFGSVFKDETKELYTLVNRAGVDVDSQQVFFLNLTGGDSERVFDCYHGLELKFEEVFEYVLYEYSNAYSGHGAVDVDTNPIPNLDAETCWNLCKEDKDCDCVVRNRTSGDCWRRKRCEPALFDRDVGSNYDVLMKSTLPSTARAVSSFKIEKDGFGCVLKVRGDVDTSILEFMKQMNKMTERPLSDFDSEWRYLSQTLVNVSTSSTRKTKKNIDVEEDMVTIPETESWRFEMSGVMVEGDDSHGVGVQYEWMQHPSRVVNRTIPVPAFEIDRFPVTILNYSNFLRDTEFVPNDSYNFLKNWGNNTSSPPEALLNVPVTYVSLGEARMYCAWRNARLPSAWEWQRAAQGDDCRLFPWGNENDPSKYPKQQTGNNFPGPEPVDAHPEGASPFGVMDFVGNTYEYTDEFQDDHTRFVILRGGSNYRPSGSDWYFPQSLELNTYEKYFLMDDRYERAGTLGFRCARSL